MVFPCRLAYNGFFLPFTTLIDIGAGEYMFIDIKTARKLYKRLGSLYVTDFKFIPVSGFDDVPN
jgi:hypothetical protein